MHLGRRCVLVFGAVVGMTFGAPVALSGIDAPLAPGALTLFAGEAAAQATSSCNQTGSPGVITNNCSATDNDVDNSGGNGRGIGFGGDAEGGDGGNGGLALMHDAITTSAASNASMSLSDSPTGDISNVVTYNIGDTDETVVILNAGNPGSTGNHMLNVGAASQAINTGGIASKADGSGGAGGNATGGDGAGTGHGGDGGDITPVP
jgi:hypothetical protein